MSDRSAEAGAIKALWRDDACSFKSSVDKVDDPLERLNLLNLVTDKLLPPGYTSEHNWRSSASNSTERFTVANPNGFHYELDFSRQPDGTIKILDEKPKDCP